MKVSELRKRLTSLKEMLSAWGASKSDLSELDDLQQALATFDESRVSELASKLLTLTDGGGIISTQRRASASVNEQVVTHYVDKLQAAQSNRASVIGTLAELKSDKKVRLPELNAILLSLTPNYQSRASKGEAIKALDTWAHRKVETSRRLDDTSGAF